MRNNKSGLAIAALAAALCVAAPASAVTWIGADGNSWHEATNWDTGLVPVDGNTVVLKGLAGSPQIDLDGANVYLPSSTVDMGSLLRNMKLVDSDPGNGISTLTCDILHDDAYDGSQIWIPVYCNTLEIRPNASTLITNGGEIHATLVDQAGWALDVDATGMVIADAISITATTGDYRGHNNWTGTIDANTMLLDAPASRMRVLGTNSFGGADCAVTIKNATAAYIFQPQDVNFPTTIDVQGEYAILSGDMTGADFTNGSITFADNSVLGIKAGTGIAPTEADLGLTPGVKDAILWEGQVSGSSSVHVMANDDGNTPYKGVALLGEHYGNGIFDGTIESRPGTGAPQVFIARTVKGHDNTKIYSDGTTKEADIYLLPGAGQLSWYHSNKPINAGLDPADPNVVTTFNLYCENPSQDVLYPLTGSIVAGQTYRVHQGRFYINNTDTVRGTVELMEGTNFWLRKTGGIKSDPNAKLIVHDAVVMTFSSYDSLDSHVGPNWIEYQGRPIFEIGGNNTSPILFECDTTGDGINSAAEFADANMQALIEKSNIIAGNYKRINAQGYGVRMGEGTFMMSWYQTLGGNQQHMQWDALSIYVGAADGVTRVGMAAFATLKVEMYCDFSANGAELQIGSTGDLTTKADTPSGRYTGSATGKVYIDKQITDCPLIDIQSGTLVFQNDAKAMASTEVAVGAGTTFQVNTATEIGTLSGNGTVTNGNNLTFATVAPGASVGELTADDLTFAEGATYEWQVGNADGATPGTDWDLISAGDIAFSGVWTLKIPEANLTGSVTDKSFIVASVTGGFAGFDLANVTIDLSGPGWSGGTLEIVDQDLVLSGLLSSLPGDADGDGDVDAADYIMIKTHFGGAPGAEGPGGDIANGAAGPGQDGVVDWYDLQLLQANYNPGGAAGTPIPEPTTLLIMMAGGISALLRRRRS